MGEKSRGNRSFLGRRDIQSYASTPAMIFESPD
jgi:hypothetical protein